MNNKAQKVRSKYYRFKTRIVNVGDIPLGGDSPIRIQTMTNTNTLDTKSSVEQIIKIVNVGSEYVRLTTPTISSADNLKEIKNELRKRRIKIPLIADVHFNPKIAEIAARIVEKVRINPGNYGNPNKSKLVDYTDEQYNSELELAAKELKSLLNIAKEYGTAIRIGVNHGSLSNRIVSRYGDTPIGMVESALEFIRLCESYNFHNIVISMKSSNVRVMIYAYRLLVAKMIEEGKNYPLHLGVTEAGGAYEGRIKSAIGIGTLLEEGIGDTIRVSLTEPPEDEIPFAKVLCEKYNSKISSVELFDKADNLNQTYEYNRRKTNDYGFIGGSNYPIVISNISELNELKYFGYKFNLKSNIWEKTNEASDLYYFNGKLFSDGKEFLILTLDEYTNKNSRTDDLLFVEIMPDELDKLKNEKWNEKTIFIFNNCNVKEIRKILLELDCIKNPIILKLENNNTTKDNILIDASIHLGSLLIDGLCDGIWLDINEIEGMSNEQKIKFLHDTSFNILQATRTRITKTEYISCPSCGRTNFDLFSVTEKIKSQTQHLRGLKIGIMGCIVNGPGEMADADYGYVGSGKNKVTLYRGKEIVQQNIDEKIAVDELIKLIKDDGRWVEK